MHTSLVVLTDFFAVSNRALSYAAGLAVPLQAHLVLLHVRHDGLLAPEEYRSYRSRQSEQKTAQALQHLASSQPVPTEVDISEDFLPEAVEEVVHRHHPLLLVLGRPGMAHAPEEIVVTTAMDLLRHAPYPLLVVPTVGWEAFPPRRLLLAVDGEPFHLPQPGQAVRRLLATTGGTLDVVHVTDGHAHPDALAIIDSLQRNGLTEELLDPSRLHVVPMPFATQGIMQEAARLEADMLVVIARRHSLLGSLFHRSVTASLLQQCPIPVLVLPAEG